MEKPQRDLRQIVLLKRACSTAGQKPCEDDGEHRQRQLMDRRLASIKYKLSW